MQIIPLNIQEILEILQEDLTGTSGELFGKISHLFYDTRLIYRTSEGMFVALQGKNDGHLFLEEAYQKGIRIFLVSQKPPFSYEDATFLQVKNTWEALWKLAKARRKKLQGKVIGITGSYGKTIVKEWLYELLKTSFKTYRSPKSFNSRLGVPLSLLAAPEEAEFIILEAGISLPGEMSLLQELILPDYGIFTGISSAHSENFLSQEQKLREKLKLFPKVRKLFCLFCDFPEFPIVKPKTFVLQPYQIQLNGEVFSFPFPDKISLQNGALALFAAWQLGVPLKALKEKLLVLQPVEMRMQILNYGNGLIINDAYNSDLQGFTDAISFWEQQNLYPNKFLVFTPLEDQNDEAHQKLFQIVSEKVPRKQAIYIGKKFKEQARSHFDFVYENIREFLLDFNMDFLRESVILLKGARKYQLEKLVPYLIQADETSSLVIDLDKLQYNYSRFLSFLHREKVIVMLKAEAYGTGAWHIAKLLEKEPSLYGFAVATLSEALQLRKHNITNPVLVLFPAGDVEAFYDFSLMPAVGSFEYLQTLGKFAEKEKKHLKIHLEFDTGMSRLGFLPDETKKVINLLREFSYLKPEGVFSHLAAAEDPNEDNFTRKQLSVFQEIRSQFAEKIPDKKIKFHIFNSAGILRFAREFPTDLVRLGIGLYGVEPYPEKEIGLKEVATLKTRILQIHEYPPGTSIGYNRSFITKNACRIATLGIGYADGLRRNLQNYFVTLHGQKAPIVGKICMDMTMIDVTHISEARPGDEVLVFGQNASPVTEFAKALQTIPYEVLASISGRVRKIYLKEQ